MPGAHRLATEQSSLGSDDSGIASSEGAAETKSVYSETLGSVYSETLGSVYSETLGSVYNETLGSVCSETLGSRASMEDEAPIQVSQEEATHSIQDTDIAIEQEYSEDRLADPDEDAAAQPVTELTDNRNLLSQTFQLSLTDASELMHVKQNTSYSSEASSSKSNESQSLLLRLFESKHFDMSMAVSYLYKCKEPGVQQYIGNRLFSMPRTEAYFYLPQLVNMYVQSYEVAEILHPFLVHCCRHDTVFALHTAWLLDAYSADSAHHKKKSHGTKFKNLILSDELR